MSCWLILFYFRKQLTVRPVTLSIKVVERDKAQRRGIDAVSEAAIFDRTIVEYMPQMAIAVARSHLGANHAIAFVLLLHYMLRLDWTGKTRPSTAAVKFMQRRKQWFAGNNVDIKPGLILIPIGVFKGPLRRVPLGDIKLLRR
jgi:hypothetical protein